MFCVDKHSPGEKCGNLTYLVFAGNLYVLSGQQWTAYTSQVAFVIVLITV